MLLTSSEKRMVPEKIPRKSLSTFRHGSLRARSLERLERLLDELALKAVVSLKVVSSSLEYQSFEASFHEDSVMSRLSATKKFSQPGSA